MMVPPTELTMRCEDARVRCPFFTTGPTTWARAAPATLALRAPRENGSRFLTQTMSTILKNYGFNSSKFKVTRMEYFFTLNLTLLAWMVRSLINLRSVRSDL